MKRQEPIYNDLMLSKQDVPLLTFDETAFLKKETKVAEVAGRSNTHSKAETAEAHGVIDQAAHLITKLFVPVNTILVFVSFFVNYVGKITDQVRAVHYAVLVCLLISLAMRAITGLLSKNQLDSFAKKHASLSGIITSRPIALVIFIVGVVVGVTSYFIKSPMADPPAANRVQQEAPAAITPVVSETLATEPLQIQSLYARPSEPVSARPTPQNPVMPAPKTAAIAARHSEPLRQGNESTPAPEAKSIKQVSSDRLRCSRILEKASSGEPLSSLEQKDLTSLCR